jgi:hypothetical protein
MALPAGSTLANVLDGADAELAVAVTASGGAHPVRLTRAALRGLVASLARRLAAAGVKPGDVVSISMANTVEFLIAFLAVTVARGVAAPLNAGYKQARAPSRGGGGRRAGRGAAGRGPRGGGGGGAVWGALVAARAAARGTRQCGAGGRAFGARRGPSLPRNRRTPPLPPASRPPKRPL